MKATTLTVLVFEDQYHVSVRIDGEEFDLGVFATPTDAGAYALKWVTDRGLCFGPNSARAISEAQRTGSCLVTFEVITRAQYDVVTDVLRNAWVDESEGILPWPFIPSH